MRNDLLFLATVVLSSCNLYILATSRLTSLVKTVAIQGIILAFVPVLTPDAPDVLHAVILTATSLVVKGVLIPHFLLRAMRGVNIPREPDPPVGYSMSLLFGIVTTGLSFYLVRHIPFGSVVVSPLHAGLAIGTACTGIFLISARRRAINQVIGYLIFENAAYLLGISIAAHQPLLVEMGVLLDMMVGVFIMGVMIYRINTEFDSISTTQLERLKL